MKNKVNIAIFASGGGSNAQAIMEHFKDLKIAEVKLVISNNSDAGVLDKAKKLGVETYVHKKNEQGQYLYIVMAIHPSHKGK